MSKEETAPMTSAERHIVETFGQEIVVKTGEILTIDRAFGTIFTVEKGGRLIIKVASEIQIIAPDGGDYQIERSL